MLPHHNIYRELKQPNHVQCCLPKSMTCPGHPNVARLRFSWVMGEIFFNQNSTCVQKNFNILVVDFKALERYQLSLLREISNLQFKMQPRPTAVILPNMCSSRDAIIFKSDPTAAATQPWQVQSSSGGDTAALTHRSQTVCPSQPPRQHNDIKWSLIDSLLQARVRAHHHTTAALHRCRACQSCHHNRDL